MLHDSYFTLSFIARKARALRNGEYPIFVRITVSGQISEMNLGRSVAPENWDQKRAMSKGRSRRDLELNKYPTRATKRIAYSFHPVIASAE